MTDHQAPEAMTDERAAFEQALTKMPAWAPEYEQHRPWVNALLWFIWHDCCAMWSERLRDLTRWKSTNAPRLEALEGLLQTAREEAAKGAEAIKSLASEREANAMLTEEVERPRAQPAGQDQHARDSAELRRLCQARDDARRERDVARAEIAGLESSVGHLSAMVDAQTRLAQKAVAIMKTLHESATPIVGPDMDACIPGNVFHAFVDGHAELMHALAAGPQITTPDPTYGPDPTQPAGQPSTADKIHLVSYHTNEMVFGLPAGQAGGEPSPTAGMNLGQRIQHVGGRENAQGYIEFGSVAAVRALVHQVLRDLPNDDDDGDVTGMAGPLLETGWDEGIKSPAPQQAGGEVVAVSRDLIRRAQQAINWHLEPNSPDEHERTMRELEAIGWPDATPAPEPEPKAEPVPSDQAKWCEYVAGMVYGWLETIKELPPEERCTKAIAGIIERRLWALRAEPVRVPEDVMRDAERYRRLFMIGQRDEGQGVCAWRWNGVDEAYQYRRLTRPEADAAIDAAMLTAAQAGEGQR